MKVPIVLFNFLDYWTHPLVNKYLNGKGNEFEGILVLMPKGKNVWLSHPFNFTQAKTEFGKKLSVKKMGKGTLAKVIGAKRKVGYDGKFCTLNQLKSLRVSLKGKQLIDASKEISQAKEIKSVEEIKKIKKAACETKKVLVKVRKKLKTGISEIEVEKFIRNEFEKDGYQTAFCIVSFGANTKNIHHVNGKKKLSEGPVLIDVGAKWKGYSADITESYWFGKKKDADYVREHKFVGDKLEIIENHLKEGVAAKDLWKLCKGLNMDFFLGHGIGVEVHDSPSSLGPKSNWKLAKGMVLAIEPATYTKRFGIRIERDYLITKNGFKKL
jgi:Xaa-Pro aminopeptidase